MMEDSAAATTRWSVTSPSPAARSRTRSTASRCTSGSWSSTCRLDVAEQVADRGVGEDRLGFTYLGGEDAEPARAGLLDGVQPQGGLADARFTLDDQASLARLRGGQGVSDGPSFRLPTESITRHGC